MNKKNNETEVICENPECEKKFYKRNDQIKKHPHHYCSPSCAAKINNKKRGSRKTKLCKGCNEKYINGDRTYCSPECEKEFKSKLKKDVKTIRQTELVRTRKFRKYIHKRAVDYLGGKCSLCGYNKSYLAFDFHHQRDKIFTISDAKANKYSWEKIQPELEKCILLCTNCHRELHEKEFQNIQNKPHLINKNKLKQKTVDYLGGCCVACGYKNSMAALDFHHHTGDKKFNLAVARNSNMAWEKVLQELAKCQLLCANCHRELHEIEAEYKMKELDESRGI